MDFDTKITIKVIVFELKFWLYLYYNSGRSSVCLSVSELLRDGWTDILHFLEKDRYYIWLGSYLCFMTLGQRSRSPERSI